MNLNKLTKEQENHIALSQKPRLRKFKSEIEKVNGLLTNIPTNDITELNDLIYAGAKLAKNSVSLSDHRQKVKARMGTQTRITDKTTNYDKQATILKRHIKIYSDETETEKEQERKINLRRQSKRYWRKEED